MAPPASTGEGAEKVTETGSAVSQCRSQNRPGTGCPVPQPAASSQSKQKRNKPAEGRRQPPPESHPLALPFACVRCSPAPWRPSEHSDKCPSKGAFCVPSKFSPRATFSTGGHRRGWPQRRRPRAVHRLIAPVLPSCGFLTLGLPPSMEQVFTMQA